MNVRKMFFGGLTILSIASSQMKAQSTIPQRELWVLGQNVINFDGTTGALNSVTSLPIHAQTIADGTAPDPTEMFVNNAYHDENGNLLFYIAAGKVYDWEGRLIGGLYDANNTSGYVTKSWKDIAILPDKCNPRVFYIVTSEDPTGPGHSENNRLTSYYIRLEIGLDFNLISFDNQPNNLPGYTDPLADGRLGFANSQPAGWIGQIIPTMTILFNADNYGFDEGNHVFGISKRQADGEYLLFATGGNDIAIYKGSDFATAGNVAPTPLFTNLSFGNQNTNTECEIWQEDGSNIIRVANSKNSIFGSASTFYYCDFDYTAGVITQLPYVLLVDIMGAPGDIYSGLEFSENGQYLYFTTRNTTSPNPTTYRLSYFDLSQLNPQSQNVTSSQLNYNIVNNFCSSQIELGKDGALYFWSGVQLGRLTNGNSPSSITPGNFTTINLPFTNQTDFKIWDTGAFPMNDQVDGEPAYTMMPVGASTPLEEAICCTERKQYNKTTFTANGDPNLNDVNYYVGGNKFNQVWSPGTLNNPFKSVNGVVAIKDRLIIPAGYTVTINNMTFEYKIFLNDPNNSTTQAPFIDGAKCVLEQGSASVNGGVLILNNTVFKGIGTCVGMWDGIEVRGNPNAVQQTITTNPLSIKSQQGRLILNTGAVIRDAYFGAANYEFDLTNGNGSGIFHNTSFLSSGGIIIANNATFKNNFIGTCFLPYTAANVMSRFTKTNFLVDAALNNPLIAPNSMSTLMGIKNMLFTSCNFKNIATTDYPIVPTNGTGLMGILSYDASFTVKGGVSVGVPYGTGCVFENLGFGIRAFNSTSNTVLVQSSVFKNNWRGSYFGNFSGTSVTKVQRNKYFVYEQPNSTPAIDAAYGHYLDYCNNFIVQENNFYYSSYNDVTGAPVGGVFNAYGCIVNEENPGQTCEDNGYKGDRIYKNLFKEIKFGAQAQGFNSEEPNVLGSNPSSPCHFGNTFIEHNQGLKYVCNTFIGTDENDITVMADGSTNNSGRIAYQQGGGSQVAGNVLSHLTGLCNNFNSSNYRELYIDKTGITNSNPNYLNYTSKNSATEQLFCFSPYGPASPGDLPNTGVISTPIAGTNSCLSKINTLSSTNNSQVFRQMTKQIYDLTQKLTDGDAQALITLINTATSGQVKTALLDKSPYLSDRVLIAAIQKNLPDLIIRDVLMGNSPVTENVKQAIDASSIHIGFKNQVKAQKGQSERALIEAQITELKDEQHVYEIESYFTSQTDSLINNTDSLISLIDYVGGNDKAHKKVKVHLSKSDFVKTNQELSVMATNLGTSHPEYEYLHTMSDVYSTYQKGALGMMNDVPALSVIDATSQRITEYDSKGAIGLKEFLRFITYREWIQAKNNVSSQRIGSIEDEDTELSVVENSEFKVYPNPSTGIFNYQLLSNEMQDATLEVYDITGKRIISYAITRNQTNGYIDLSNVTNGIYFVKVANSHKILFNSKVNVIK